MSAPDPRVRVLAGLLTQGRTVHLTTGVFTLGTWGLAGWEPVFAVLVGLVFVAETWFAARVGLDAVLFEALAAGVDPSQIDRGLVGLGLMRERGARPLGARIRGAVKLWRWQLVLAFGQGVLFGLALVLRVMP